MTDHLWSFNQSEMQKSRQDVWTSDKDWLIIDVYWLLFPLPEIGTGID